MQTGSLTGGQCYETASAAADALWSSIPPFSYTLANPNKLITVSYLSTGVSGEWIKQTDTNGVIVQVPVVNPAFSPCGSPSDYFSLGLEYGGALVAILALAWSIAVCVKVLR